jgi:hypothetical protein
MSAARHPARSLVWSLQSDGWTERQAGNLVALLHGLRPATNGWSAYEIEHLCWIRTLARSGRLKH